MSTPDAALRERRVPNQDPVPEQPLLSLSGITKSFGSLRAVDGASFSVSNGSLTALIGPNGAGKTTTFNLIAGTQRHDRGEILFEGRSIAGLAPDQIFRLGLARTFQVPRPFASMTVLENLMLAPRHQLGERFANNWFMSTRVRLQEQALRERAARVLETCALAGKSSDLAGALSGGQQKLLELARVLMIDPKLILLDEPAAGVNPALLETLIDRVRLLNRQGITFLLIEHNMDMVMRLCDPVIVMAQGRVLVQGSPAQVREDPRVIDAYLGEAGPA
jgi:ABC-type branched-subunit amino acid transport system ATPase component